MQQAHALALTDSPIGYAAVGIFVLAYAFVIELASLGGRERLLPTPCVSIIHYD